MKKFLAVYTGSADARRKSEWETLPPAELQRRQAEGIQAWGNWMQAHKASILDSGGPLGKTKRTGPEGVSDTRNNLAGYVIVQADSHQAAADLFRNHPHFTLFPGDSVEVMECLPVPGQS